MGCPATAPGRGVGSHRPLPRVANGAITNASPVAVLSEASLPPTSSGFRLPPPALLLAVLGVLWAATPAQAHRLDADYRVRTDGRIQVESWFDVGGKAPAGAQGAGLPPQRRRADRGQPGRARRLRFCAERGGRPQGGGVGRGGPSRGVCRTTGEGGTGAAAGVSENRRGGNRRPFAWRDADDRARLPARREGRGDGHRLPARSSGVRAGPAKYATIARVEK